MRQHIGLCTKATSRIFLLPDYLFQAVFWLTPYLNTFPADTSGVLLGLKELTAVGTASDSHRIPVFGATKITEFWKGASSRQALLRP